MSEESKVRAIEPGQLYLLAAGIDEVQKEKIFFCPGGSHKNYKIWLIPPFDWNGGEYKDNNWHSQLQMWRPLDNHIIKYGQEKDPAWLQAPQNLMLDWWQYYKNHEAARYVWADMNAGMRLMKIAFFLSLHNSQNFALPDNVLEVCQLLAREHLDFIMNPENLAYSNHTFMDIHGAMALGMAMPGKYGEQARDFAHATLERLMARQFDEDGTHKEHSPQYQLFAIACLRRLIDTGWFDNEFLQSMRARARDVLQWMYMPDGRFVPVGDTDGGFFSDRERRPSMDYGDGVFNKSGYVIFYPQTKARSSYLFFMCARHSLMHKHSDDLSLIWYEHGDILCDAGKYAYQSTEERRYVMSTRAHNTLEIDACDEYSRGRPGRPGRPLTIVEEACKRDELYLASAIMFIPQFHVTHRRVIIYLPDKFLVVGDAITSFLAHDYILNWHFSPQTAVSLQTSHLTAPTEDGRQLYMAWHASIPLHNRILNNSLEPRMHGFISPGYKKLLPADCLAMSCRADSCDMACAFTLNGTCAVKRVENGCYMVEASGRKIKFNLASRPLKVKIL